MNETIKTFYENEHLRETVREFLLEEANRSSLRFDFEKSNEEVGAQARALVKAKEIINDSFNSMAESKPKEKGDKPNPAI